MFFRPSFRFRQNTPPVDQLSTIRSCPKRRLFVFTKSASGFVGGETAHPKRGQELDQLAGNEPVVHGWIQPHEYVARLEFNKKVKNDLVIRKFNKKHVT